MESNKPLPNEDIVSQLVSMGFNHHHCEKAAIRTSNAGVEEAMNWLLSHMEDPGISNVNLKKKARETCTVISHDPALENCDINCFSHIIMQ